MATKRDSSKVRNNWGKVKRDAISGEDIIIVNRGEPEAVLISYKRYRELVGEKREASEGNNTND